MRTFGVEEELMVVDGRTRLPMAAGEGAVHHAEGNRATGHEERPAPDATARTGPSPAAPAPATGTHTLTVELQQEQVEVVGPPCTTLAEQLAAIRRGRVLADDAARAVGGRAVALATSVAAGRPHLVPERRYRRIQQHVGLLAAEQLTCGHHVHVHVEDREEGVAVLDRIRVWLPVLLALSANSPFWYGVDSGFASYRYQVWSRWPTVGPCEVFGSARAYDEQAEVLLRTGVPLDDGMLYYDARLSAAFPTVEVRVGDVCMDPVHAAVLAALVRALVETAARRWRAGEPPAAIGAAQLRAWTWRASRFGVDGLLISPATGTPRPSGHVAAELLELLRPVLDEYGEDDLVQSVVTTILDEGSGARRQRQAFARRHDAADVVDDALDVGTPPAAPEPPP
ncbi:glutamate--cysteine ligase [Cellulosimicrobium cellulans]|uniref:glutamate--cysteine ligase n=1 Tax=Cellulosimicrobium cellulans TaxID=1710 RepID=UPI000848A30E|nr:glutamate--cysteine ligase [Cellulosimicrobium cellulans]